MGIWGAMAVIVLSTGIPMVIAAFFYKIDRDDEKKD